MGAGYQAYPDLNGLGVGSARDRRSCGLDMNPELVICTAENVTGAVVGKNGLIEASLYRIGGCQARHRPVKTPVPAGVLVLVTFPAGLCADVSADPAFPRGADEGGVGGEDARDAGRGGNCRLGCGHRGNGGVFGATHPPGKKKRRKESDNRVEAHGQEIWPTGVFGNSDERERRLSGMPVGFGKLLTRQEFRNLPEFISSLK